MILKINMLLFKLFMIILFIGIITCLLDYNNIINNRYPVFVKTTNNKNHYVYTSILYRLEKDINIYKDEDLYTSNNIKYYLFHFLKMDISINKNKNNNLFKIKYDNSNIKNIKDNIYTYNIKNIDIYDSKSWINISKYLENKEVEDIINMMYYEGDNNKYKLYKYKDIILVKINNNYYFVKDINNNFLKKVG